MGTKEQEDMAAIDNQLCYLQFVGACIFHPLTLYYNSSVLPFLKWEHRTVS